MDVRIRCPVCKLLLCVACTQPEKPPGKEVLVYRRTPKEWEKDHPLPTEMRYCYKCWNYFYGDDFVQDV